MKKKNIKKRNKRKREKMKRKRKRKEKKKKGKRGIKRNEKSIELKKNELLNTWIYTILKNSTISLPLKFLSLLIGLKHKNLSQPFKQL